MTTIVNRNPTPPHQASARALNALKPSKAQFFEISEELLEECLSASSSPTKERTISDEDTDDYAKYSFFPTDSPILSKYYHLQKNMFWTPQEIALIQDKEDWGRLSADAKIFIKFILAFFAQTDGLICENLTIFTQETSKYKEAQHFYAMQAAIETIHNETYSLFIETFFESDEEKRQAFNAIKYNPAIRRIAEWVVEWMRSDRPLSERVIAFACVEGILFSSAFAGIYWLKRQNIMKEGLCKANEFIARDEALHTEFAVALYHVMTQRGDEKTLQQATVHTIVSGAVKVAEEFTRDALKVNLVGINADDMVDYVKCTADKLVTSLGYNRIYNAQNPFDWMAIIGLPNKSNFIETRVTEYGRQNSTIKYDLDIDF